MEYDNIDETTWGDTNSYARDLQQKYQGQFNFLSHHFNLDVHGPFGLTAGYRSTEDECKVARVVMSEVEFEIDVTAGIANQVVNQLLAAAKHLEAEARRLKQYVADGKFPQPE
jgi:hypothetical protein